MPVNTNSEINWFPYQMGAICAITAIAAGASLKYGPLFLGIICLILSLIAWVTTALCLITMYVAPRYLGANIVRHVIGHGGRTTIQHLVDTHARSTTEILPMLEKSQLIEIDRGSVKLVHKNMGKGLVYFFVRQRSTQCNESA